MSTNYPGALDAFPTDIDNVTIAGSPDQNNRAAALVALQKNGYPVYNVKTFQSAGAKGDVCPSRPREWRRVHPA